MTPYDSYRGHSKEIIKSKAYHFDYKNDETCEKWLDGKDLNRYFTIWNNKWISYGDWLAAPRERKYFEDRRILFREEPGKGKRIQASIVDSGFFYGHSISLFKPHPEQIQNLKYTLGIVNSKLMSWIGGLTLPNFSKDIFPKLNSNDIKELFIPKEFIYFIEIDSKVTQILDLKKANPNADTSALEAEIDQLVYALYKLTEEEIKIVEESVR